MRDGGITLRMRTTIFIATTAERRTSFATWKVLLVSMLVTASKSITFNFQFLATSYSTAIAEQ